MTHAFYAMEKLVNDAMKPPAAYTAMQIGKATVVIRSDETGLLCVQRDYDDTRKVKLNSKWRERAKRYLDPAIEG